ncbi:styrene monooxygenase/indole monooxygenase family protein [Streptomyces sp. I05A-00742]|uniref:styrene monooxygenase/indole monooxygenase family protein n=1 Tax=Streptomyces sp. I05A-00742 TaxID=2732853 RepID=UPI001487EB95|nr:styrene monooxygenase/indole monooxygenase family protein [Streptomyces sp. I05A-00742]
MRRIAIVGAGQAGLHLALGLQGAPPGDAGGYEVLVVTDRTPEQIRAGRVQSTQLMFGPARALERAAGLNLWDGETPWTTGNRIITADPPGTADRMFGAPLDEPAQSVDLRVKTARWLELFEERGGRVEYRPVSADDLPGLAAAHDLTLLASGRGGLGGVLGRDGRHSPYDRPQRALAVLYLHGVTPLPEVPGYLRMTTTPGTGELLTLPGRTLSGPCTIVMWQGVPGGPFDCWQDNPAPDAALARTLELMRVHAPWDYERCADAEPTDGGAALTGSLTPVVRHPVADVAPGSYVLGMADAVVLNDPLAGQGSNNAAHCADRYLRAILDRGTLPFDRAWAQETFASWWEHARHTVMFSNLLVRPLPDHVQRVVGAAPEYPEIAHRYVNGFAHPADYREWLLDADRADAYLAAVTGGRTAT